MVISMGDIYPIERSNTPQRFGGPQSDLTALSQSEITASRSPYGQSAV